MPRARAKRLSSLELSNNIVGLTANVEDLQTTVYQYKAVADDRHNDMHTNMGAKEAHLHAKMTSCILNCEEQLRENDRQMYQAQKRVYNIMLVCIFAITWLMLGFGWLCYEEAIAEQARVDAGTVRVANFKKLLFVIPFFLRDWLMTRTYAEYYRFTEHWFS